MGPAPFSDIGKRAKDLLTRDYNFDQKFTLTMSSNNGMGLTANGLKKDQFFVGDISTQYKTGGTTVDVKVDTGSSISTTVTLNEVLPCTKVALNFKIPDQKSGKLDMQYLHPHAAINSSIGLTSSPQLELAATLGTKDFCIGAEVGFDSTTATLTKYNAAVGLNTPDFSAGLVLADKGEALRASYIHAVNPATGATIAAEMTHRFSTYKNSFTIGSSYPLDPSTVIKTRYCDNGKISMLCQHEWRPKSLVTVSTEYDRNNMDPTKFGLALTLKP
ncbi:hypothetical protein MKX03_002803 [Papaver bracteatum]|nr:hypothetical protein MKX03_002803 [Papaver bracteatum]